MSWLAFEGFLQEQGRERVPEEVLTFYRQHQDRYLAYRADCEVLRRWALGVCMELEGGLGGRDGKEPPAFRKSFAALVGAHPHPGLLFAALDGRLDLERVRKSFRTPEEVRRALAEVGPRPGPVSPPP
jgi:hypothetical protein